MRRKNDAYYTVDAVARRCVRSFVPFLLQGRDVQLDPRLYGLEPSCGSGSFLRAVNTEMVEKLDYTVTMDGVDLQSHSNVNQLRILPEDSHFRLNYIQVNILNYKFLRPYDFVIGNPPFSEAEMHLTHLFAQAEQLPSFTAGFLLRCGFRHSSGRKYFWDKFPCRAVEALRKRPSFTGDGKTDASEYDFFIWQRRNHIWIKSPDINWID